MPTELPKTFDPKAAQQKWLAVWDEKKYFHSEPDPARKPFTVVIPPPNVTGALHLGHALNNTLQDVLVRWRRMQGFNALWMPGTDHAGIATQSVVERRIREEEGKTRRDLGRDELVKRIWAWKDQYEARILGQLKQMGASCDFARTRFTLDPVCARAVRETFFRMFRDGYIYRGKRLVNWDAALQTSVADDETYTEDTKGGFWTFKYEVVGAPGTFVSFSTTRPETMLGDSALCVHPGDERYKALVGKTVRQPLVNRDIPIIADGLLADPTKGTGCVKVTPAHDPNDYACWQRHPEIEIINMLNPDGTVAAGFEPYSGQDRMKAREQIVKDMEALGLYEGREDRVVPLKFSDRSKTPIEPLLSDQWFVRMADRDDGKPGLSQMAMEAVTSGRVKVTPERYASSYLDWLGEKRDWCISRQLWWGHRIPAWRVITDDIKLEVKSTDPTYEEVYEKKSKEMVDAAKRELAAYLSDAGVPASDYAFKQEQSWFVWCCLKNEEAERAVNALAAFLESHMPGKEWLNEVPGLPNATASAWKVRSVIGFEQEEDVLDTWFSSALWPHSTLGWPEPTPEVAYYYPTSVLCTSRDIITLWVARMVLTGLYNLGEVPFRDVYIHPKILDGFGETMSKSKGNGVDPLDVIELYGADALRFGMASLATETQDSRLPVQNVCPHCGAGVPVKQEHMYLRTKKLACPTCKKPFRPGGPWPTDDPELPTAKQGSDRFEQGRNFANKLWNATRFLAMNLDGYSDSPVSLAELPTEDRWILSRLATTTREVTAALEGFRFAEAARLVYDFAWGEFCDWYVEMAKGRLADAVTRPLVQRVLVGVLDGILRLIAPVMPFLAESLWAHLGEIAPSRGLATVAVAEESVCVAAWPGYPAEWTDAGVEARFARMQDLVRGVREVRNRYQVDPKSKLDVSVKCGEAVAADFTALGKFTSRLADVGAFVASPAVTKPKQAATITRPDFEAYVALAGLIDPAAEASRLEKQIAAVKKQLGGMTAKLGNASYVQNAPPDVVAETRAKVTELEGQVRAMEDNLRELQA